MDVWPRTRTEWDALEAERDREPAHFKEAEPEYAAEFDALQHWLDWLRERYLAPDLVYDEVVADQLVGELYHDAGHPVLNSAGPDFVNDILLELAAWPEEQLPGSVRRKLVDGFLEYIAAGGGRCSPAQQAESARALDRLAPDDAAAQAVVEELLTDALEWAYAVGREYELKPVKRCCREHWGPLFELRLHELETREALAGVERPESYRQAVESLADLLTAPVANPAELEKRLRQATEAALHDFQVAELEEDALSRLLIVYRCLLTRRPEIAPRVTFYIDNQLLRLAVKDQVRSARHWRQWSAAVSALGPERISQRLRRYVSSQLDRRDLPKAKQEAMDRLRGMVGSAETRPTLRPPAARVG